MKDGITETPQEALTFLMEREKDGKAYQCKVIGSNLWENETPIKKGQHKDWCVDHLFRCHFRLPLEPKRVPLEQSDWVDGPWWIKGADEIDWSLVVGVDGDGRITYPRRNGSNMSCHPSTHWLRSKTCRPDDWHPCSKEEK